MVFNGNNHMYTMKYNKLNYDENVYVNIEIM